MHARVHAQRHARVHAQRHKTQVQKNHPELRKMLSNSKTEEITHTNTQKLKTRKHCEKLRASCARKHNAFTQKRKVTNVMHTIVRAHSHAHKKTETHGDKAQIRAHSTCSAREREGRREVEASGCLCWNMKCTNSILQLPKLCFSPSRIMINATFHTEAPTSVLTAPFFFLPPIVLFEMANVLNTGLDKQSLSICVELLGKPASFHVIDGALFIPYIRPRFHIITSFTILDHFLRQYALWKDLVCMKMRL